LSLKKNEFFENWEGRAGFFFINCKKKKPRRKLKRAEIPFFEKMVFVP